MAIEDIAGQVLNAVGELVGLLINAVLRKLGFTELKAKKIVDFIGYLIIVIIVIGLFYITFKYS